MENGFYTLQDFFYHTKSITYILMVAALVGIVGFWKFLTGNEDD